ncbi:MAG: GGDEF domain-containing protein, partial [Gammaproteobacteria bacterium]|nr:GGDEF domain-containing protein [Gammaproteobacteria bacterium]
LDREVERAARLGHELCLIMLDIDHFKSINDNYGHQVGDDVIVTLANAIGKTFRSADLCCRYGGEEFVIIMPDASTEGALAVTTRLQKQFANSCRDRKIPVTQRITFTAGISSYPVDGEAPETLLRTADDRLYHGKRGGRDRIETHSAGIVARA